MRPIAFAARCPIQHNEEVPPKSPGIVPVVRALFGEPLLAHRSELGHLDAPPPRPQEDDGHRTCAEQKFPDNSHESRSNTTVRAERFGVAVRFAIHASSVIRSSSFVAVHAKTVAFVGGTVGMHHPVASRVSWGHAVAQL